MRYCTDGTIVTDQGRGYSADHAYAVVLALAAIGQCPWDVAETETRIEYASLNGDMLLCDVPDREELATDEEIAALQDAEDQDFADWCAEQDLIEALETLASEIGEEDAIEAALSREPLPFPDANVARKDDQGKADVSMVPLAMAEAAGRAFMFGEKKYARNNWKKPGMKLSRLLAAGIRHMMAAAGGEELDPESGLKHTDHAAACIAMYTHHVKHGTAIDDIFQEA